MKSPTNKTIKRTQKDYNLGFKLAVVSQVEKGEMTYKQAQMAYGTQGRNTVLVWLRKQMKTPNFIHEKTWEEYSTGLSKTFT